MMTHDQIVHLYGKRLNFALLSGRVVEVFEGDPTRDAIAVHHLETTRNPSDEGVSGDGTLYIGALGIICLADHIAKRGVPARSGKVIMDRLLKLFPGSLEAPTMIKATVAAALGHPGMGGEHDYFTACALRGMQDWSTDSVEVEVADLPKVAVH